MSEANQTMLFSSTALCAAGSARLLPKSVVRRDILNGCISPALLGMAYNPELWIEADENSPAASEKSGSLPDDDFHPPASDGSRSRQGSFHQRTAERECG